MERCSGLHLGVTGWIVLVTLVMVFLVVAAAVVHTERRFVDLPLHICRRKLLIQPFLAEENISNWCAREREGGERYQHGHRRRGGDLGEEMCVWGGGAPWAG